MATKKVSDKRLVVNSALCVLKVDDLLIDPTYQREVKRGAKKIAADFKKDAFGIIVVAQRKDTGQLYIVDGQQRVEALKILGRKEVRAEVFASDGPEHEAEVFKQINLGRVRLTPREEMRAMLIAGDKDAWAVKNAVENAPLWGNPDQKIGFHLATGRSGAQGGWKDVVAYRTLLKIVRKEGYGPQPITKVLSIIYESWPEDKLAINADIIDGMCIWWKRYDGVFDEERLINKLRLTTPHKILYAASQMTYHSGGRATAIAEQIERIYRRKTVNRNKS